MTIFEFEDYKRYLSYTIEINSNLRGYKTRLAAAAQCQKPYISQVLGSNVHLTPEHAMGLAQFWNFTEIETDYWLELVQLGRTSSAPLKNRIHKKLGSLRRDRDDFAKRFNQKSLNNIEVQAIYYSDWIFSAIHRLSEIEKLQTLKQLSQRLNLSIETIVEYVSTLERLGLLKKEGDKVIAAEPSIHLARDSAFNLLAHQNWRIRAITDIQNKKSDGIHYSAIQTISLHDFVEIKNMILNFIDQQRKTVIPSRPEEVACFTMDWFKV